MHVFIIHGAFGHSQENWIPWLKRQLEGLDHQVYVPKFPTPEGQNLSNWRQVFSEYDDLIDEQTIFIGHSLGSTFILDVLEHLEQTVHAAFLVAGFTRLLGNDNFDKINRSFVDRDFDWLQIRNNCQHFFVYQGDDDPYLPADCADCLAKRLDADKKTIIKEGGHLNEAAGFQQFKQLLADIKTII